MICQPTGLLLAEGNQPCCMHCLPPRQYCCPGRTVNVPTTPESSRSSVANRSGTARPIVYMVYGRRWFFDDINYINRIPLDMPLERYHELPETVRPLLVRAFSYAMLTRWREAELPGAASMIPNA